MRILAAIVVAVMYAGGAVLEDFAVARAERDLKSLADRAPRIAHRRRDDSVEDIPVDAVQRGDTVLVKAGEIVPVDGVLLSSAASLDELALTGEPLPEVHRAGDGLQSGAVNAGETFEMQATATAGESTYAGIVRLVTAAQTAKAPFIRMADNYALLLLPVTLVVAGAAWLASGDTLRGLAVLVASTPCPLILAAPVAFIAGVSRAARHGILIKGGGPLEALARVHTVLFDKTGTLTVGGLRVRPGELGRLGAGLQSGRRRQPAGRDLPLHQRGAAPVGVGDLDTWGRGPASRRPGGSRRNWHGPGSCRNRRSWCWRRRRDR